MQNSEDRLLIDAGIYPEPDKYKQALDGVGGFMTMIETVLNDNKKWTMHDILHQWYLTTFQEDIDDEKDFVNHTIGKLMIHLIMKGHKRFHIVPPREFIPIYRIGMNELWWDLSERKIKTIISTLSDIFNITPYQYTITQ